MMFVVQYFLMLRHGRTQSGTMRIRPSDGEKTLRLSHLKAYLPIKGPSEAGFFFRAKKNLADGGFVWLDLRHPSDAVPLVGDKKQAAVIKVTPLFETPVDPTRAPSLYPFTPEESESERARIRDQRGLPPLSVADARRVHASSAAEGLRPEEAEDEEELQDSDAVAAMKAGASAASSKGGASSGAGGSAGEAASGGAGAGVGDQLRSGLSIVGKQSRKLGTSLMGFFSRAATAAQDALEGGSLPSDMAQVNLQVVGEDAATKFRPNHEPHESLLERVWDGLYPDKAGECVRVGPQWVRAGFGSENPGDDVDSVLTLKCLVYLVERHGDVARGFVNLHRGKEDDGSKRLLLGPTAGLLARELTQALSLPCPAEELAGRRAGYYGLFEEEDGFFELHFLLLTALHRIWVRRKASQSQLQAVSREALSRAAVWLDEGPKGVEHLRAVVSKLERVTL